MQPLRHELSVQTHTVALNLEYNDWTKLTKRLFPLQVLRINDQYKGCYSTEKIRYDGNFVNSISKTECLHTFYKKKIKKKKVMQMSETKV